MKLAIVGKKCKEAYHMDLLIPKETTEIVVLGTKGISPFAKEYALSHNIKFTEFLPERKKLFKKVNNEQNDLFVEYSDMVMQFGNKLSKDVRYIVRHFQKEWKKCIIVMTGQLAK